MHQRPDPQLPVHRNPDGSIVLGLPGTDLVLRVERTRAGVLVVWLVTPRGGRIRVGALAG